jgi:hypothetical protein
MGCEPVEYEVGVSVPKTTKYPQKSQKSAERQRNQPHYTGNVRWEAEDDLDYRTTLSQGIKMIDIK